MAKTNKIVLNDWKTYREIAELGFDPNNKILSDIEWKVSFQCTCPSKAKEEEQGKLKLCDNSKMVNSVKPEKIFHLWSGSLFRSTFFLKAVLPHKSLLDKSKKYFLEIVDDCIYYDAFESFIYLISVLHSEKNVMEFIWDIQWLLFKKSIENNHESQIPLHIKSMDYHKARTILNQCLSILSLSSKYNFPLIENVCHILSVYLSFYDENLYDVSYDDKKEDIIQPTNQDVMEIFERNCRKTVSIYGFYSIGRKKSLKNMNKDRVIISLHRKPPMRSLNNNNTKKEKWMSFDPFELHLFHKSTECIFCSDQYIHKIDKSLFYNYLGDVQYTIKKLWKDYSCYQKKNQTKKEGLCVINSNNHFDQTTVTQRMNYTLSMDTSVVISQQSCLNEWFTVGKIYIQQKYYDILLGIELFYKENDSKINIIFRMVIRASTIQQRIIDRQNNKDNSDEKMVRNSVEIKLKMYGYICGHISIPTIEINLGNNNFDNEQTQEQAYDYFMSTYHKQKIEIGYVHIDKPISTTNTHTTNSQSIYPPHTHTKTNNCIFESLYADPSSLSSTTTTSLSDFFDDESDEMTMDLESSQSSSQVVMREENSHEPLNYPISSMSSSSEEEEEYMIMHRVSDISTEKQERIQDILFINIESQIQ